MCLALGCGDSFTSGAGGSDAAGGGESGSSDAGGSDAGSSDAAPGTDASPDASPVVDSAPPEGAAPDGSLVAFSCGGTPCSPPAQTCCGTSGAGGQTVLTCQNAPVCSAASTFTLHCQSNADCPSPQACCFQQPQNVGVSACLAGGCGNGLQLCDPNASAPQCANGQQCSTNPSGGFNLPPGFAGCSN
jgi:hypothetical protein